jgi:hypothetical protein
MNCKRNSENRRFAACAAGARLLQICASTARRAPGSKNRFQFPLSAGGSFRDRQHRLPKTTNEFNALRNFLRENYAAPNDKKHLEIWPQPAPEKL